VLANVVGPATQLYGNPEPIKFLLDIRDEDWNNLVDAKAMADSARELNV
jgi:hypothetical protein